MKVITTNLLNRFWKNGVLKKLELKVDTAKIINNFTTTVAGNVADARALKTLRDLITGLQNKTDELNGNLESIIVKQGDFGQTGSIAIFANIVMQKITANKCNIHIQFRIEAQNPTSESYIVFNMSELKRILGIHTLSFEPAQSRFISVSGTNTTLDGSVRCGFSISASGEIFRFYKYGNDTGLAAIAVKNLFEQNILKINDYYTIDIWGATYSS